MDGSDPASITLWYVTAGGLFVLMALSGSYLKRLPLSTALIYLIVGFGIGPWGLGLLRLEPTENWALLERLTELGVLVSLFTAGLKLRPRFGDRVWRPALIMATFGMVLTVGLVALVGWLALGLSVGAAVLLGAVLAPTDPVLASGVQARDPLDRDRVRFSLTGEAGLNDGTAFPFVMLGLGLLGLHELGTAGWRWLTVDVVWAVAAGLGVGALLGIAVARLVVFLRREHKEAVGLDDFLALGLIGLSYGVALFVHAYGFLAVFAAGLALRREERREEAGVAAQESGATARPEQPGNSLEPGGDAAELSSDSETDPSHASAYMAKKVLEFNEMLERITEVALVLVVGSMLSPKLFTWESAGLVAFLLLFTRPVMAWLCLTKTEVSRPQVRLIAWFGIRGIGSIYYLSYALSHGLSENDGERLSNLVLAVVAASIVLHGITVTPVMKEYQEHLRS